MNPVEFELSDSGVVLASRGPVADFTGHAPDELEGLLLDQLLHPHDADVGRELLDARLDDFTTTARLIMHSGSVRCVRVRRRREGARTTVTFEDAVTLARAAAPMQRDRNFVAMMETTDDYIYFKDRNHVFTGASQTLVSLTYPTKHWTDLLGKTDYDVFPRDYADRYYKLEKQVFGGGCDVAQEIQPTLTVDGKRGWVDNRKYPIRDERGDIVGLFGIARDITKLVTAEDLARQAQLSQLILEEVGDAIVAVTAAGVVSSANRAARDGFGLHVGDTVTGTPLMALLGAPTQLSKELRFETPRRGQRTVVASTRPLLGADGAVSGTTFSLHDVTEQREAALQLGRARDAAEQLAATKSRFLATMSHEIRTPLNAVIGLSELGLEETDPTKLREYLSTVHRSSTVLLGIVNDILDFSKIEAGRLRVERAPFSLAQLMADLKQTFELVAEQKGVQLLFDSGPCAGRVVVGDALRVRQVLSNLLSNAFKFTERGRVSLTVECRDGRSRFIVTDTGIGMSEAQLSALFEPFTQVDTSTTRRFGGTGLGLAISRQLAELMGGTLTVTSQRGLGSTFTFDVPLENAAPGPAPSAPDPATWADLRGLKVLLVEDNAVNQMLARSILTKAGVVVTLAGNGEEAVKAVEGATFDLVLMDIQMPVMDGLEATSVIRRRWSAEQLPVIALTAHAMAEERERCLAAGMNQHLSKPLRTAELAEALRRWGRRGAGSGVQR